MFALHYIVLLTLLVNTAPVQAETVGAATDLPIAASTSPEKPPGDKITLKSGRTLRGVKILRTTPFKIFLEVLPSVEPLSVPIRQVVSIEYGPRESQPSPALAVTTPENSGGASSVLQAVRISPDLMKKMTSRVTEKIVEFNDQDLVNILRSTGILSGVPVSFSPQLEGLEREKRTVSLRLEVGVTFDSFIRDTLMPSVPWLKVEYRFDSILFDCTKPVNEATR